MSEKRRPSEKRKSKKRAALLAEARRQVSWNTKYGMGNRDENRLAGKPSSGYAITEDDPRWNPRTMGNKRGRKK
jgi:hypothetical protein